MNGRLLAGSIALLGLLGAATWWGLLPPAPSGPSAPADTFSASRAASLLESLYAGVASHPVGSPSNRLVRDRILDHLESGGLRPRIQRELSCREPADSCAVVENILVRLEGRPGRKAVMLSTHYDSVPAGPGASDAGVSVAALLEIARIIDSGPSLPNPVIFFIGDGEEAGLLGARAFVSKHPWAKEVGAVVNLEARGSSGRSWMFETSAGGAWLVDAYARSVPHPATASVAYGIYKRLPTDTDLTVYKAAGLQGVGFAFIDRVQHYHTPLDNLGNLTAGSLQQQGANALALTRELASMDLQNPPAGEAVYFDLFGLMTVHIPAPLAVALAGAGLLLAGAACLLLLARRRASAGGIVRGFAAWWGSALLAAGGGAGLLLLLDRAGAFPTPYPAHDWAHQAAAWAAGASCALIGYGLFSREGAIIELQAGSALAWALLGAALTALDPAVAYLAVIPALALGASTAGAALTEPSGAAGRLLILLPVLSAVPLLQLAGVLFAAMGRIVLPVVALLVALIVSLASAPVAGAGRRTRLIGPLVGLAACAALAIVAALLPAHTETLPRRLSLAFHQNSGTAEARWAFYGSRPLPAALLSAAGEMRLEAALPWWGRAESVAVAASVELEGPIAALDGGPEGSGTLRAHLRSPRGAPVMEVALPRGSRLASVSYPGLAGAQLGDGFEEDGGAWRVWRFRCVPPEGIDIEIVPGPGPEGAFWLLDRSPGLPASGAFLQEARPAWALPSQTGDVTVLYRELPLLPGGPGSAAEGSAQLP